jgi:hypothetical protein
MARSPAISARKRLTTELVRGLAQTAEPQHAKSLTATVAFGGCQNISRSSEQFETVSPLYPLSEVRNSAPPSSQTNFAKQKVNGTGKPMILVPLCDLKFLIEFAARDAGTSNRH